MEKFVYHIMEKPRPSGDLENYLVVENKVNDILCLHIVVEKKLLDTIVLHPFQKQYVRISDCYKEDVMIVLDDDEINWDLLEFQEFKKYQSM